MKAAHRQLCLVLTSLVFHLSRSLGRPDKRGRHSNSLLGRNTFLGPLFSAQRHRQRADDRFSHKIKSYSNKVYILAQDKLLLGDKNILKII